MEALDYKCGYCGIKCSKFTFDHVYPLSRFGKEHKHMNNFRNGMLCCKLCNTVKSDMTLRQFQVFIFSKEYKKSISDRETRQKLNRRYGEMTQFHFEGKRFKGRILSVEHFEREFHKQKSEERLGVQS